MRPFQRKLDSASPDHIEINVGKTTIKTCLHVNDRDNHKAIIRNIALMTDYYPVYQSTYICKEAISYELFNFEQKYDFC